MRIHRHASWLLGGSAVCLVCLACFGCRGESSSAQSAEGSKANEPIGPEESFEEIVRFVERQLETGLGDIPSGFVMESGGRRSHFIVRNDVTSELIPPKTSDGIYRGTITVTSSSTYWYRRMEPSDKPEDNGGNENNPSSDQRGSFEEGMDEADDFESFDRELVPSASPAGDSSLLPSENVVSRQENQDKSTFHFAYENGRWTLKTETDSETERAIQRAFERALRMQPQ